MRFVQNSGLTPQQQDQIYKNFINQPRGGNMIPMFQNMVSTATPAVGAMIRPMGEAQAPQQSFLDQYGSYGFDPKLQQYLAQQAQASTMDAGIAYQYDPTTKTFTGGGRGGPQTLTMDQMLQKAGIGAAPVATSTTPSLPMQPQMPQMSNPFGNIRGNNSFSGYGYNRLYGGMQSPFMGGGMSPYGGYGMSPYGGFGGFSPFLGGGFNMYPYGGMSQFGGYGMSPYGGFGMQPQFGGFGMPQYGGFNMQSLFDKQF